MDNWVKRAFYKTAGQWQEIEPTSGKPVWQVHIDKFWEVMKRMRPELDSPEFEEEDFGADERNSEIFREWMTQVIHEAPELMEHGNLHPDFETQVRQYLMQTRNFDPFPDSDAGGDIAPGGPEPVEPDIGEVSPEDLDAMFADDTFDPGSPEQRRSRNEDIATPPADELDAWWR